MLEVVPFVACLASRPEIAAWHLEDAWSALGSERTWPLVETSFVNTNDGVRANNYGYKSQSWIANSCNFSQNICKCLALGCLNMFLKAKV